jgi:hypothetical protein
MYEERILLKSKLIDCLKELSDELLIYYDDFFIIDKCKRGREGRFRAVICYIIYVDETQIKKFNNVVLILQRFFHYSDTYDIHKIIRHVKYNPNSYAKEIRLCKYYLSKHKIISQTLEIKHLLRA